MRITDEYYYWEKGEDEVLLGNFRTREFTCTCSYDTCKTQRISQELIQKLHEIRIEIATPIKVTSGFRCDKKQADLRGSGILTAKNKSTHEEGNAADVSNKDMVKLLELCEAKFESIGLAKTFYHLDIRKDKKRRWNY